MDKKRKTIAKAKGLWEEFGNVPMDPETECIEMPWQGFPAGTHREEVWHWFEETFGVSVAEDLMGHEGELAWNGLTFQLVDHIFRPYFIWNIGKNMPDGYLPLCRLKQVQPWEHAMEIETDSLLALRTDGAQTILAAIGAGPTTPEEMRRYIFLHRHSENAYEREMADKMQQALPYMDDLAWT